ncbi:glycoside hydrolase family 32 protein [Nocardioides aestuarii]|uniref:beta-fructofuranosidase n=1 Tax=Nocardioides aestuarii TaxID=252231 RepID=A0ABW4TM56_9ACTN
MRDPHRPTFHLVPPSGWLNDPNGLGQWDGVHHAFYQHNPDEARHDRIAWGHATSDDLVHWRHEPVALRPDTPADADGCWSGVLVDDGGTPTLVYSGHREGELQQACLALGSADLRTWRKHDGNPVLTAHDDLPDLDLTVLRDHCVWREDGRWRMLMGAGFGDGSGGALLFDSPDLRSWTYAATLASSARRAEPDTGSAWECPDLFGLDGRHVLTFSAWHDDDLIHALAWTGHYEGDAFTPDALHRLDLGGGAFYAPQSYRDDSGRRIMLGWLPEARPEADCLEAGWAGVMSLPRELTLRADGTIHQQPVAEVATLRGAELSGDDIAGDALDVELRVTLEEGGSVRWRVRGAAYELRRDGATTLNGEPVPGDGQVDVRVVVDHSVVEVFANGTPLTTRSYTGIGEPLSLEAERADVTVRAWEMGPA